VIFTSGTLAHVTDEVRSFVSVKDVRYLPSKDMV